MKVMVDTNVIISALLFTESVPAKALFDVSKRHDLILCDYIIEEIYDVIRRKRPDLIADTDVLLAELTFESVVAPREASKIIGNAGDATFQQRSLCNWYMIFIRAAWREYLCEFLRVSATGRQHC